MDFKIGLEQARSAFQSRDPFLVDILVEIANEPTRRSETPLPEGRYTFEHFVSETARPAFYRQPADIQRQYRQEKIALLESETADQPLSDRLRSFELILELWRSPGAFERDCLLRIIREVPLVYGPWKALKQIFKEAEAADDTEVLGALSVRFHGALQGGTRCDVSKRTLRYLARRCWRYLRTVARTLPSCYADTAVDFLVDYRDDRVPTVQNSWVAFQVFFHDERSYTRTKFRRPYRRLTADSLLKHRAFTELWQRSPLPLFSLLERANSEILRGYAVAALKKDFRNTIRDIEPAWVKRILASPHRSAQEFAVWVLENVPSFEQSRFRELGLHDTVLKLFESPHDVPLEYVASYARTHARDLPIDDLVRLANHSQSNRFSRSDKGSGAVRKLAVDLLSTYDARKDVGLERWYRLLGTEYGNEFAQQILLAHFTAKDLTPEWFMDCLLDEQGDAAKFAAERLTDLHPAKKLGASYFYQIVEQTDPATQQFATHFALRELSNLDLESLTTERLETLVLHPVSQTYIARWVTQGLLSPQRFAPEFLKGIAYHKTFDQTPQVVAAKQQSWGRDLEYSEFVAAIVFGWLSDIRLFTPDQVGFQWLMELAASNEASYHDFAVETMTKAFLPADFIDVNSASSSDTSEEATRSPPADSKSKTKSKSKAKQADEINVDFDSATFVFTGKLATMTRGEAQKKVTAANGKNVGTVSKTLDYLVIGDEGSPMYGQGRKGSKQVKAESLAEAGAPIRIISETAFLQMLTGKQREFSEDAVVAGCENLWKMLTESEKENSPRAKFALHYMRRHHPEICLAETDRPVDPGSEIPDSFLTFERVSPLLNSSQSSLRKFALELSKWEFARWSPSLEELAEFCESRYADVRRFVTEAILCEESPQTRRYRLNPETFTTDAVYQLCQSRDGQVRSLGMQLIKQYPRLREPVELFKLTESPDRAVRAFVIRAFWSAYRDRGITESWRPAIEDAAKTATGKHNKQSAAKHGVAKNQQSNAASGEFTPRSSTPPASAPELQFLLRRMLFEIPPGRPPLSSAPQAAGVALRPIPTRRGKLLLVETIRDLAVEDVEFARLVLPVLVEFMESSGRSEHDVCLVAVARIESAHPKLLDTTWRHPTSDSSEPQMSLADGATK